MDPNRLYDIRILAIEHFAFVLYHSLSLLEVLVEIYSYVFFIS
jgi:hypothetical protein